jgi:hypothetical protein
MSKRLACLAAVMLLGLVAADEPKDPAAPPALELQVEINGKPVVTQTDKTVEVEVGGQKVQVRVTMLPYRIFDRGGLRFRYPSTHAWEVDLSSKEYTMWTLDGNSNVIMLTKYTENEPTDNVVNMLVTQLTRQYGRPNVQVSPTTLKLGAMEVKGQRLDVRLANQHLRQDLYAFQAGGATFSMILQDSPEEEKTTKETQDVIEMLGKTFEVTAK